MSVELMFANNDNFNNFRLFDNSILNPLPQNATANAFKALQPFFSPMGRDNKIKSYGPGIGSFEDEYGTDKDAGDVKRYGHNFLIARQGLKAPGGYVEGCRLMDDKATYAYVMVTVRINDGMKVSRRTTQTSAGTPTNEPVKFVSVMVDQLVDFSQSDMVMLSSFGPEQYAAKFGKNEEDQRITATINYRNGKFNGYTSKVPTEEDNVRYVPLMILKLRGRGEYGNNYQFRMSFDNRRDGNLTDGRRYKIDFQKVSASGLTTIVGATSQEFTFALNPEAVMIEGSDISDSIVDKFEAYRNAGYLPFDLKYNGEGYKEIIDLLGDSYTPAIGDDNDMIDFIFGKQVDGTDYRNIIRGGDTVNLNEYISLANGNDGDVFSTAAIGNYLIGLDGLKDSADDYNPLYPYADFQDINDAAADYFPEFVDKNDDTYYASLEVDATEYKKFTVPTTEYDEWTAKRHSFYTWFMDYTISSLEEHNFVAHAIEKVALAINPTGLTSGDVEDDRDMLDTIRVNKKYKNTKFALPESIEAILSVLFNDDIASKVGLLIDEAYRVGQEYLMSCFTDEFISTNIPTTPEEDGTPDIFLARLTYDKAKSGLKTGEGAPTIDAIIEKYLTDIEGVETTSTNLSIILGIIKNALNLTTDQVAEMEYYMLGDNLDMTSGWFYCNSNIFDINEDFFNASYMAALELSKFVSGVKSVKKMLEAAEEYTISLGLDVTDLDPCGVKDGSAKDPQPVYKFLVQAGTSGLKMNPEVGVDGGLNPIKSEFVEKFAWAMLALYDQDPDEVAVSLPADLDNVLIDMMISDYSWNDVMISRIGSARFPNLKTKGEAVRAGLLIDFYAGNIDINILDRRIVTSGVTFDAFNDIAVKNYMGGVFGEKIRTDIGVFLDLGEEHSSEATVEGLVNTITASHFYGAVYRLIQNGVTTDRARNIRTSGSYEMIYKMFEQWQISSFKFLAGVQAGKVSRMKFEWYPTVTLRNRSLGKLDTLNCIYAVRIDDVEDENDNVDLYFLSDKSTYGTKYSVLNSARNTLLLGHIIRTIDRTLIRHTHLDVNIQIANATDDLDNQFAGPIFPKDTPIVFRLAQTDQDMIEDKITCFLSVGFPNVGTKFNTEISINRRDSMVAA